MTSQLVQVLKTYVRRPLVLMLAVVAVMLGIALVLTGMDRRSGAIPIAPELSYGGHVAWVEVSQWEIYFQGHDARVIDTLLLHDSGNHSLPDLSPLKNVSTIRLSTPNLSEQAVAQLATLDRLQRLSLQTPTLPPGTWKTLGPKLRGLEIPARLLMEHSDEVAQLERLETLRLDPEGLTPEVMSVVAQIPNLRNLVVTSRVIDSHAPAGVVTPSVAFTTAAVAPLKGHPHLKAIFVDWSPELARTTTQLPGVAIYPAVVSRDLWSAVSIALFLTAVICGLVVAQLWVQFSSQHSLVIPGFAWPHQLAAVLVLGLGVGLTALGLSGKGVAWAASLVVSLYVPTVFLCVLVISQARSKPIRMLIVPLALSASAVFYFPTLVSTSVSPTIVGEIVWFLKGENWRIALAGVMLEGGILACTFRQLPTYARRVYERSALGPGLSPWDPQQQRRTTFQTGNFRWLRDYQGGSNGAFRTGSLWQQARLWQVGNAYRPLVFMVIFGGMIVLYFLGSRLLLGGAPVNLSIVSFFLVQLGMMALLIPVTVWFRRCRMLQVESLRPVARPQLIRQLFTALARDQAWAILPVGVATAWLLWFTPLEANATEPLALAVLGWTGLVWGYALSTAVFAIRRSWALLGYVALMILLPVASLITVGIVAEITVLPAPLQIRLIYIFSLATLFAAVIVIRVTYKRALKREWGLAA